MLKRRYANSVDGEFALEYIDDDIFKGHICRTKLKCDKPLIVNDSTKDVCIKDDGYVWLMAYPSGANYALTIIYDNELNLVEYYFDIAKEVGVENGIPYEDDLFLDLVITAEGKALVLDEDELLDAKERGVIDDNDVELAYKTLTILKEKYANNIGALKKLEEHICEKFHIELSKNKQ